MSTNNVTVQKDKKLELIDKKFKKAEILLCDAKKVKALDDDSFMKKLCLGIKEYICRSNYEGSITVYELFHVKGYKTTQEKYRQAISSRLQILRLKHKQVHLDFIIAA